MLAPKSDVIDEIDELAAQKQACCPVEGESIKAKQAQKSHSEPKCDAVCHVWLAYQAAHDASDICHAA